MDLSNYEDIVRLAKKLGKRLSKEDREDLVQEVCLKMLVNGYNGRTSRATIAKIIKQIMIDQHRLSQRKPLVFDNELVERAQYEDKDNY